MTADDPKLVGFLKRRYIGKVVGFFVESRNFAYSSRIIDVRVDHNGRMELQTVMVPFTGNYDLTETRLKDEARCMGLDFEPYYTYM